MSSSKSFAIPLSFIGIMFFSLGFALGINSLLVPVLQGSLGISNAASYLIIAATFIPFLVFGYPAGLTIKAIGYKKTMSLSFVIFAAAFYLFILSADEKSFPLFLLASFVSGAANAYLQASVNPYITILGPLDSAAKRISMMGICNKLAWPIPSIFIVWLLGKDVHLIGIEDLSKPFWIIIVAFLALGVLAFVAPLPEVKAADQKKAVGMKINEVKPLALQMRLMAKRLLPAPMLPPRLLCSSSLTCCWAVWHCSSMWVLKPYRSEPWWIMPTLWACRVQPTMHGLLLSASSSVTSAASS